jgi:hypothetical protein
MQTHVEAALRAYIALGFSKISISLLPSQVQAVTTVYPFKDDTTYRALRMDKADEPDTV